MTATPTTLTNDQEIELKLALDPGQLDAFTRLMTRRRVAPTTQNLRTRYFDSPDFSLGDLGVALRLRRVGRRWVQTLKVAGASSGGLSVRKEYESPVVGDSLDFLRLPEEALTNIPTSLIEQLIPMFETRFKRTAWTIRTRDRSVIEVALDIGAVLANGREQAICEIELELKAGRAEALLDWAQALAKHVNVLPLEVSKAERGIKLARAIPVAPTRAGAVKLNVSMTVEDGFAVICNACLAQFQANLPGLLCNDAPEYLHQARVALRRLRAALRLFRRVCPLTDIELQQSLRDWGAALGPARDWDVLCLETLPAIAPHFADTRAWAHFAATAEAHRQMARETMRTDLMQSNPGRVLLQFQQWLLQKSWRDALDVTEEQRLAQSQALPKFVRDALHKGKRKVRHMARDFNALAPEARHSLRILIKRQRYAAEFFAAVTDGKNKPYMQALVIAQDGLGRANDAHVASVLLATMTDARDKQVAAFVEGWLARTVVLPPDENFEKALTKLA